MKYPAHDPTLPVVCIDFDGVFAENCWPSPKIGDPALAAFDLAEHYYDAGCQVVILTARPESHFPRIWEWLHDFGIGWAIYDVTNKKIPACLYIDDRAVRWPLEDA